MIKSDWIFESRDFIFQAPPGYWLGYLTPQETEASNEVVLPSHVVEVTPISEQASADMLPF
jgi:hypothetical protein